MEIFTRYFCTILVLFVEYNVVDTLLNLKDNYGPFFWSFRLQSTSRLVIFIKLFIYVVTINCVLTVDDFVFNRFKG